VDSHANKTSTTDMTIVAELDRRKPDLNRMETSIPEKKRRKEAIKRIELRNRVEHLFNRFFRGFNQGPLVDHLRIRPERSRVGGRPRTPLFTREDDFGNYFGFGGKKQIILRYRTRCEIRGKLGWERCFLRSGDGTENEVHQYDQY